MKVFDKMTPEPLTEKKDKGEDEMLREKIKKKQTNIEQKSPTPPLFAFFPPPSGFQVVRARGEGLPLSHDAQLLCLPVNQDIVQKHLFGSDNKLSSRSLICSKSSLINLGLCGPFSSESARHAFRRFMALLAKDEWYTTRDA